MRRKENNYNLSNLFSHSWLFFHKVYTNYPCLVLKPLLIGWLHKAEADEMWSQRSERESIWSLRLNSQRKKMLQLPFKKMVPSDLLQLCFLMAPTKNKPNQNWTHTTSSVIPLCPAYYGQRQLGTYILTHLDYVKVASIANLSPALSPSTTSLEETIWFC